MCPGGLWRRLLACRTLHFLALGFVGDTFGICHEFCVPFLILDSKVALLNASQAQCHGLQSFVGPVEGLRFLQLGVFLDQLFQAKPRKLYRNLGVFPVSLAFVD